MSWESIISSFEEKEKFSTPLDVRKEVFPQESVMTEPIRLVNDFLIKAMTTPNFRGMIFAPPQEFKSSMMRAAAGWALNRDNNLRIINASYDSDLAAEAGREVRFIADSIGLTISGEQGSKTDWRLESPSAGRFYSVSMKGGIAGRPCDLLLIDDPVKGEDALSPGEREKMKKVYSQQLISRLSKGASIILTMTRWHEDDLAGYLLARDGRVEEGGKWEVLHLPAQWEEYMGEDSLLGRKPGEFLESARGRTHEDWESRKGDTLPADWESLYQGNPSPKTGAVVDVFWVKQWESIPGLSKGEWLISCDLAASGKSTSDYTVFQAWVKTEEGYFMVDMMRGQWQFPDVLKNLAKFRAKHPHINRVIVETAAGGQQLVDTLKREGILGVVGVYPMGSKESRLAQVSPIMEAGNLYLRSGSWFTDICLNELARFPKGANDDTVDTLSQAILYFEKLGAGKKKAPARVWGV